MIYVRSIDEVWYKRAVEQYYVENTSFVYSIPFNDGKQSYFRKCHRLVQWNRIYHLVFCSACI